MMMRENAGGRGEGGKEREKGQNVRGGRVTEREQENELGFNGQSALKVPSEMQPGRDGVGELIDS